MAILLEGAPTVLIITPRTMSLIPDRVGAMILLAVAMAAGCAAPCERPGPPVSAPLPTALASLGSATMVAGSEGGAAEVVLLKDRHAVGPGIFYVEEPQRVFHRQQHAVVAHLV